MATLNQLSSRIVNMIGQPDNHELRERVKDMFKNIFAKYIRQSSERHGIDEILTLSFIASIDELDYDTIRPSKYRILNKRKLIGTVNKLPVPIRIFNDSPYLYVGSVNGEAYKYINNPTELVFQNSLFPPNETICYVIENGRILLYKPDNKNTLIDDRRSINEIMIKAVWENPEEILTMFEDNDGQDIELPFPSDMIETAIFELLKVEFNIISRDNDIKLKDRNLTKLKNIYKDLEFFSMLKKLDSEVINNPRKEVSYILVNDKLNISKPFSFYLEVSNENYHTAKFVGLSIYDGENTYILSEDAVIMNKDIFSYADSTYDLKKSICFLRRYGIVLNNCKFDNMISTYLLNYNIKDDISYIANTCGYDIPFYDSIVKNDSVIVSNEQLYSILSSKSKYIYETKSKYINELVNEEMINLFNDIEMPLVNVLASMEINGIRASSEVIDELHDSLERRLSDLTKEIYGYAGCEFNIQSAKQMGEVLFEKLDLPHGKKKGKNGYSTDHDTLIKYYDMHPIIKCILEYRNLYKLMSGYTDKLKSYILEDGKIHTIYKQAITRTGRLSSVGPNLQNIPVREEYGRLIRKAFIPSDGGVIISSDYSQIELRVFAHMSGALNLIEAFNKDMDIHTKTAMDIYHIGEHEVTKNERRNAKAVNFGILYGISSFGLSEDLGINVKDAKKFIDNYLETYPGIKDYMNNLISKAHEDGYVKTMFGRKRVIDELSSANYMVKTSGERMALNTPIQGTSADILKIAMIEIHKELKKKNLKTKMIIQVHDELLFDTPRDEYDEVVSIIKEKMEGACKLSVPLKVDIESGDSWYEAK